MNTEVPIAKEKDQSTEFHPLLFVPCSDFPLKRYFHAHISVTISSCMNQATLYFFSLWEGLNGERRASADCLSACCGQSAWELPSADDCLVSFWFPDDVRLRSVVWAPHNVDRLVIGRGLVDATQLPPMISQWMTDCQVISVIKSMWIGDGLGWLSVIH